MNVVEIDGAINSKSRPNLFNFLLGFCLRLFNKLGGLFFPRRKKYFLKCCRFAAVSAATLLLVSVPNV